MMKTMPASIILGHLEKSPVSPAARFGLRFPPPFSICFNEESHQSREEVESLPSYESIIPLHVLVIEVSPRL
jgi:hypothetical protein